MRKAGLLSLCFVMVTSVAVLASAPILTSTMEVEVEVCPQTIILHADGHPWVTAHAEIAYGDVDCESLTLNGVAASRTEPDLCGNLVALFSGRELKRILQPGVETLVLTGLTADGEPFSGSDTVLVKDK